MEGSNSVSSVTIVGEIAIVNEHYQSRLDREAGERILRGEISAEVIKRWRESADLAKSNLAWMMGYTRQHILAVEAGKRAVSKNFAANLQTVVIKVSSGLLPRVPDTLHPIRESKHSIRYVPFGKLAATKGEWRKCSYLKCGKWKFFTIKSQAYCNNLCQNRAWRAGQRTQPNGNRQPDQPTTHWLAHCPGCGAEFPIRGHLVRENTNQGNGQAQHEQERQVGEKAEGSEVLAAMRPDSGGVWDHADEPILVGGQADGNGEVRDESRGIVGETAP